MTFYFTAFWWLPLWSRRWWKILYNVIRRILQVTRQILTTHISSSDFALVDDAESSAGNAVRKMVQSGMIEKGQNMPRKSHHDVAYPRWRSIMVALSTMAVGLARLVPMISEATWRHPGSKRAYSYWIREHFPLTKSLATYPSNIATRDNAGSADKSSSNVRNNGSIQIGHDHDIKLTRTSNKLHRTVGILINNYSGIKQVPNAYVLSTIMSLNSIPADLYSSATRRKVLRNRPSPSFMMLALCTHVTFCKIYIEHWHTLNR